VIWVFDPVNLVKPWYTRQSWTQLTNNDKQLRIRYWDCEGDARFRQERVRARLRFRGSLTHEANEEMIE
jgi:hypothetical protein